MTTLELVGYADPLSAAPGEQVRFHVSSHRGDYDVEIVRLIHGAEDPAGPGLKVREVPTSVAGTYRGRPQALHPGSYVHVPSVAIPAAAREALAVTAWICPTLPQGREPQGIVALAAGAARLRLSLEPEGDLSVRVGEQVVRTGIPLDANEWHFVGAWLEDDFATVRLVHEPQTVARHRTQPSLVTAALDAPLSPGAHEVTIGAGWRGKPSPGGATPAGEHFNGRIARPLIAAGVRAAEGRTLLRDLAEPADLPAEAVVAAWDLSQAIETADALDAGPDALHGRLINVSDPRRAGPWLARRGDRLASRAPSEYGAIHFHDDDLEDAGWEPDFALDGAGRAAERRLRGAAARRRRGGLRPVLRPPAARASATAPIAFLAPTLTYLAYANCSAVAGSTPSGRAGAYHAAVRDAPDRPTSSIARPELGLVALRRPHATAAASATRRGCGRS